MSKVYVLIEFTKLMPINLKIIIPIMLAKRRDEAVSEAGEVYVRLF
jgi:hypothetical protein